MSETEKELLWTVRVVSSSVIALSTPFFAQNWIEKPKQTEIAKELQRSKHDCIKTHHELGNHDTFHYGWQDHKKRRL
jgi:hypothetical protein